MTSDSVRAALHARPFEPFRLCLSDGRTCDITDPETLMAPPGARTIVVYLDNDRYNLVDLLHVASLDFGRRRKPRRNGRRNGG